MLAALLRRYLAPYKRELTVIVALQLVSNIASLFLPSLNADIIDQGITHGDTWFILETGGVMFAVAGLQIACSLGAVYFGARAAMSYGRDLRGAIFHHIGTYSQREVNKFGAPSLITRTTNDVTQIQVLVMMLCTMVVTAPIMCIGGIVMALREDVALSKLLLVAVPLLAGAIGFLVSRMIPLFRKYQPKIDTVNRILREQINGMRVVRAFVRERHEAARFETANADLTATGISLGKVQAVMFPTVMIVFNASSVAVLWFGSHLIASGELQIGAMSAFLTYLMQILVAVMITTFMSIMIPRAAVCAERITEVLRTESSVVPPRSPVAPDVHGNVELEDVEFRYPGAELPVLAGVRFSAKPGTTTAIIGGTGSGKTTLLDLIPRLIDTTAGAVRVDGVDVRGIDPEALWARIGMVPQRPYLFLGTVATNLRYGKPDATDDELWAALELAQARDFVEAMPEKLNAPIAQGGTNVSGGQRQRLSIARALLRKPAIYLFDDSFSALDLATEARLRAALKPHVANATVILVAQRVASIVDADQIVVLDAGKVVGIGTHEQLAATNATYQEIISSQRTAEAA
jgi:ATP-binding cassette subfamily B protein